MHETVVSPPSAPRVLKGPKGGSAFSTFRFTAPLNLVAYLVRALCDHITFFHSLSAILSPRTSRVEPLVDIARLVWRLARLPWRSLAAFGASLGRFLSIGSSPLPACVFPFRGALDGFLSSAFRTVGDARALINAFGLYNSAVDLFSPAFTSSALCLCRASCAGCSFYCVGKSDKNYSVVNPSATALTSGFFCVQDATLVVPEAIAARFQSDGHRTVMESGGGRFSIDPLVR